MVALPQKLMNVETKKLNLTLYYTYDISGLKE